MTKDIKDINELTTVWYETPNNEEIAKLRAEIEQLQTESDISDGLLADAKAEIERLKADQNDVVARTAQKVIAEIITPLHDEIEQLRALLRRHHLRGAWWDPDLGIETRAALGEKP